MITGFWQYARIARRLPSVHPGGQARLIRGRYDVTQVTVCATCEGQPRARAPRPRPTSTGAFRRVPPRSPREPRRVSVRTPARHLPCAQPESPRRSLRECPEVAPALVPPFTDSLTDGLPIGSGRLPSAPAALGSPRPGLGRHLSAPRTPGSSRLRCDVHIVPRNPSSEWHRIRRIPISPVPVHRQFARSGNPLIVRHRLDQR